MRAILSRKPVLLRTAAAAIALLLSGCLSQSRSSGTPIDPAKVSRIEKGKTTRAEVEALLGKPDMTMMVGDGRRSLSYAYTSSDVGVSPSALVLGPFARVSGTIRTQTLQVTVGKDGLVEDYELSDGARDLSGNAFNTQSTNR